jgi:hypothetical protein
MLGQVFLALRIPQEQVPRHCRASAVVLYVNDVYIKINIFSRPANGR